MRAALIIALALAPVGAASAQSVQDRYGPPRQGYHVGPSRVSAGGFLSWPGKRETFADPPAPPSPRRILPARNDDPPRSPASLAPAPARIATANPSGSAAPLH
ncbi:MAG: hypothetical protein ACYC8V_09635, partial [Caulobacteraceae bacterium]